MWPHWSDVKCTFLSFPKQLLFSRPARIRQRRKKDVKHLCAFNFCLFHQLEWPLDQVFLRSFTYCDLIYIVVEFIWLYLIIIVWITFLNYLGTQHKSPHCILDQSLWIIFAFLTSIFIPLLVPLHLVYLPSIIIIIITIIIVIIIVINTIIITIIIFIPLPVPLHLVYLPSIITISFIPLLVPLHLVYLIHHLTILISIITIIK